MAELNFKKLADAPVLEEAPDGAKVYAEVDGKVYRVAGDNLGGGGIPTAIFTLNMDTENYQRAAGDNSRAAGAVYTVTCDNMTFAEAEAIFKSGGQVNALLCISQPGETEVYIKSCSVEGGYVKTAGEAAWIGFTFVSWFDGYAPISFYWHPDETISSMGDK